jgi:hypothetical protein
VLDTTVNLFKASFRYCWPAALLYSILNLVLTVWMQQRLLAAAAEPAASVTEVMALLASPAIWGGYLLMFIASVFINLVITTTILDVARNRPSGGALAQLGSTLPLLPGALGLFLVIMLGVMVGGIVLAIVAGMAGAGAGLVGGSPGAGGAAVIGFLFLLLLAVPCLYLVVRWSLWSAAYTDRRKGAFAAMGTSWNLVDGNWWRTLVIVSVVGIIIMVLVILLAVLTGYFAAVSGQDSFAQILVSAALQAVMQVLYLPALSACLVATYMDLQLRKGGADLEARLGSLGPQA